MPGTEVLVFFWCLAAKVLNLYLEPCSVFSDFYSNIVSGTLTKAKNYHHYYSHTTSMVTCRHGNQDPALYHHVLYLL